MESFQKTMQVFLDVQKATMLAYLERPECAFSWILGGRPVDTTSGMLVGTNGHDVGRADVPWAKPR